MYAVIPKGTYAPVETVGLVNAAADNQDSVFAGAGTCNAPGPLKHVY